MRTSGRTFILLGASLLSVQAGGAFAGYPLGLVQQRAGWEGVFCLVAVIALVSAASAVPLWAATAHARPMIRARHGTVADFEELKLNKTYIAAILCLCASFPTCRS